MEREQYREVKTRAAAESRKRDGRSNVHLAEGGGLYGKKRLTRSGWIRCSNNTSLLLLLSLTQSLSSALRLNAQSRRRRRSPFSLSRLLHSPITSFEATPPWLQLGDDIDGRGDADDADGRSEA